MAYAMTKRGSQDNIITYEFICDDIIDMNTIENKYRTIGSVAVVLQGESGGLEVYIAGSNHQWYSLGALGMGDGGNDTTGFSFYICGQNEVSNGLPDISEPSESTIYLVPATDTATNDLFIEYIWTGTAWEKFGAKGATIDLSGYATLTDISSKANSADLAAIATSGSYNDLNNQPDLTIYAPKANPIFTGSISLGRSGGSTVGDNSMTTGTYAVASGNNSFAQGYNVTASANCAHAEGANVTANGVYAHAEGTGNTIASGSVSHAEGAGTIANGTGSHSEGNHTVANGAYSHVSGIYNVQDNHYSWPEWTANTNYYVGDKVKISTNVDTKGYICKTSNSDASFDTTKWTQDYSMNYAVIVGNGTGDNSRKNIYALGWDGEGYFAGDIYVNCNHVSANGAKVATLIDLDNYALKNGPIFTNSISLGRKANTTVGYNSVALGDAVTASGAISHAEGYSTIASGTLSHAEGCESTASGATAHAEGNITTASGEYSHAEGGYTVASGAQAHAEGYQTTASGQKTHTEGYMTKASNTSAHAEGYGGTYTYNGVSYASEAKGVADHIEGYQTRTENGQPGNHAEGYQTSATGGAAHSEGINTLASGNPSHAEGYSTVASASTAHAEGNATTASGAGSHSEGQGTTASGAQAHTEGNQTTASGSQAHAEGDHTTASGAVSHAEGNYTTAGGILSHTEGYYTIAKGAYSHVSGLFNIEDSYSNWPEWSAQASYAVGDKVKRTSGSTVTGYICKTAHGPSGFTDSFWTTDYKMNYAEIIGNGTSTDRRSNARTLDWEGNETLQGGLIINTTLKTARSTASGEQSTALGYNTTASGTQAHAEGMGTIASGMQSHTEGVGGTYTKNGTTYTSEAQGMADHTEGYMTRTANGQPGNHAEGYQTAATGGAAHAEGSATLASGIQSHAEGSGAVASGVMSHAEGYDTVASGTQSHAEGDQTIASGDQSHAEGSNTQATQSQAHAEGMQTQATNIAAHAEGYYTIAAGSDSHAEGVTTLAKGSASHAEGVSTIAAGDISHISGKYNIADNYDSWAKWTANTEYAVGDKVKVTTTVNNETITKGYICKTANSDAEFTASKWTQTGEMNYAVIIGNGTTENTRSNAYTLGWDGTGHFAGDVYVGCNANSTGGSKVATETALNALIARVAALEAEVQSLRTALTPESGE